MKRKFYATIIAISAFFCLAVNGKANQVAEWQKVNVDANLIHVIDVKDVSAESVTREINLDHNLVIEIVYGVCLDDKGNGVIMNMSNGDAYINYAGSDIKKGDVVMSAFIYAPDRNGVGDYEDRYDFVIDSGFELSY